MFFKDIPGKEKEKEYLLSVIKEDRLAHAQLFLGRQGAGQLALALAFSSYILCTNKLESDSCGQCSACIKSHKYVHPDMHFSFPVVKKDGKKRSETTSNDFLTEWRSALNQNAYLDINYWLNYLHVENGQANINVKECLEIIKKLGLKTFESDYKILVMWLPEYLRNEGNRLLKLIEEPPENTLILLVAENQDAILNTILSRVQLLKVMPFSHQEIKSTLVQKYELKSDVAEQISSLSGGNMNISTTLAKNEELNFSEALFDWLRIAYKMEPVELGNWVNNVSRWGRERQKHFLEYGLHFFREYLFSKVSGQISPRLNQSEQTTAQKMSSLLDERKTENIIRVLNDNIAFIARNANPKILFLNESMKIGRIMRNIDVDEGIFKV